MIQTKRNQQFGRFEVLFLIALKVFINTNAEHLVIEAGIGGKFDPSRLLFAKLCALTSIDLEHTKLLGSTFENIASDKFAATAPGGHCVIGQLTYPHNHQINQKIENQLAADGAFNEVSYSYASDEVKIDVITEQNKRQQLKISLHHPTGKAQSTITVNSRCQSPFDILNWQHAIALYARLSAKPVDKQIVEQALNQAYNAGRFEVINQEPEIIIDAAHTPAAYQWLFDTIARHYQDKPFIFVIGLSKGRDIVQFKQQINPLGGTFIITQGDNGIDAKQIAQIIETEHVYDDIANAMDCAVTMATQTDSRIFVIGGLFLAASASAYIKNRPYHNLHLF